MGVHKTPSMTNYIIRRRRSLAAALLSVAAGMMIAALMFVAMLMLKQMGASNTWAAGFTSLLLIPIALRGVLRPLMEATGQSKWWSVCAQGVFAFSLAGVASSLSPRFESMTVTGWLVLAAVALAVHIVASGKICGSQLRLRLSVMVVLAAMLPTLGVAMMVAGDLQVVTRDLGSSWSTAMKVLAVMLAAVAVVAALSIPHEKVTSRPSLIQAWQEQTLAIRQWWRRGGQWLMGILVVFLSLHEWMLWRGVTLFLNDLGSIGGLSLGPQEVGFAQGTVGTLMLMVGVMAGMALVERGRWGRWLWPMLLALTLPDALMLYLAYRMPSDILPVCLCVGLESLFAGFGMAGLLAYFLGYGKGRGMEVHASVCVTLIVVSACIAGVLTGFMQDYFGFRRFFLLVLLLALFALLLALFAWVQSRKRRVMSA